MALWSLLLACTGGLLCDRVGRRPLFLLSTGGIFVFFLLQTVCTSQYALHGNKAAGDSVVAFICMFLSTTSELRSSLSPLRRSIQRRIWTCIFTFNYFVHHRDLTILLTRERVYCIPVCCHSFTYLQSIRKSNCPQSNWLEILRESPISFFQIYRKIQNGTS